MNSLIEDFLFGEKIDFVQKVDLSKFTWFKTGGLAKFIIYPKNVKELKKIVNFLEDKSIFCKAIGATTNLLFLDEIECEVLISLKKFNKTEISKEKKIIKVEAGVILSCLVRELAAKGITGFEGLEGIPGTIGGAVFMNAGAYGYEISDNLIGIEVLTKDGDIKSFLSQDLNFKFRHSVFKERNLGIILNARFRIRCGNKDEINKKIGYFSSNRKTYQEHKYPNLGSVFATKDLYSEIARHHFGYKVILYFIKKLKALLKPSDNKILNIITCWYFNLHFKKQPFSDKTMNCLINNNITSKESVAYIKIIRRLTKDDISLENEIVQEHILK